MHEAGGRPFRRCVGSNGAAHVDDAGGVQARQLQDDGRKHFDDAAVDGVLVHVVVVHERLRDHRKVWSR